MAATPAFASRRAGVEGAVSNLDGRVAQNTSDIAGNTTAITTINQQLGSGTIGLVQQAGAGQNLTVGKDTDGAAVDFRGTTGARRLKGVAAGGEDEDAVNVSQLRKVTDALGGEPNCSHPAGFYRHHGAVDVDRCKPPLRPLPHLVEGDSEIVGQPIAAPVNSASP